MSFLFSRNNQFAIGALLSYSSILFNIISGLLYTPWMIRTIGDDQYALYTLALSVINIFLLDFGIGAAVTKFLSNYYAKGKYDEADRFMGVVYKVFCAISLVIAAVMGSFYFLIGKVYTRLTVQELETFKTLYIIVATYSVCSFPFTTFNGILMANERFIEVKTCNLGQKILSVVLVVAFLLSGKGVYALVTVHTVSNAVFLALKYYFIRKKTKQRSELGYWDRALAKRMFSFSVWITVISLAQRCIFNIMPTLIAATVNSAAVTLFSLAYTLEGYVYIFADAINGMFMPKISRILAQGKEETELSNLMIQVGRFHVYTIGLLYIGFICIGRNFVELWMGKGYEAVYLCTLLLIFPSLIDVPQQIAKTTLMVSDIVKAQGIIYVGMAVINVVLSLILLPRVGVIGAAVSVCISYLARTAAFNVLYHKKLPIHLWSYFKSVYGRWLVVAGATCFLGSFIEVVPFSGWYGLLLKAVLIGIIYVVSIWFIVLNRSEKAALLKRAIKVCK